MSFNDLDGQYETPTPTHTPDSPNSTSSVDEWSKQLDELDKLRNSDLVINELGLDEAAPTTSKADSDCFPPPPPPLPISDSEYLVPPDPTRVHHSGLLSIHVHRPVDNSDLTDELSAAMDELSAVGGLTAITSITDFDDSGGGAGDASEAAGQLEGNGRIMTAEMHLREVEEQLQNIFTPTPMELFKVKLHKLRDSEDFGFGLSDGVYEKGVYISALRPGSPADRSGILRMFDRVLQVSVFGTLIHIHIM